MKKFIIAATMIASIATPALAHRPNMETSPPPTKNSAAKTLFEQVVRDGQ